jgi:glycerol uptake facilitator-like aquaporin
MLLKKTDSSAGGDLAPAPLTGHVPPTSPHASHDRKSGLRQQLLAEFIGTATLLCAVIGSGIMAERLSSGNMGLALLANTLTTVFALYVLIEVLGPVSGAHFNPLVTLVMWSKRPPAHTGHRHVAIFFIASQLLGAVAGAWLAHAMFDMSVLQFSSKVRSGGGQWLCWPRPAVRWPVWCCTAHWACGRRPARPEACAS